MKNLINFTNYEVSTGRCFKCTSCKIDTEGEHFFKSLMARKELGYIKKCSKTCLSLEARKKHESFNTKYLGLSYL